MFKQHNFGVCYVFFIFSVHFKRNVQKTVIGILLSNEYSKSGKSKKLAA